MSFSNSIPSVLQEYPNVEAFTSVLDSLQNFKSEFIAEYIRSHNSGVLMDKKWILKRLEEFGVTNLPLSYPIEIMRQYLLNVDTICRTRGSKKGIELYCSLLSLGEVTVDDSDFYLEPTLLLLDSRVQGFITDDNSMNRFYLCDDNESIKKDAPLEITIKSKYFRRDYPTEKKTIKTYIESTIYRQLPFNARVHITYLENSEFYFHELLNPYFV